MSFIFVIAIVFLASYLIRNLYSFSLVKKNNALQERFDKHEWDGLDKDLIKLAQTTAGMANKKNQLMIKIYNNCHMMLAAIAYLSGDKDQFCHWIQHTRDTENFPHIFAVLALYTFGKAVYDIGRDESPTIETGHIKPLNVNAYGTDED